MIRLFAGLFSFMSIGFFCVVGGMAGLVHIYGQGLPSHDELVNYQPKMLSRVYSGEGKVIAQFARQKRIFAPIDEVPELLKNAFISAEDKNFYSHPGVDAVGIAKAIVRYGQAKARGGDPRLSGASTISQQVMKNFLVGNDRSFERKIKEAILAVRLDGALSKDLILELYINEIFLGARSYGVVAAAQNYFGKTMEELTPAEAAYIAALPKAPSNYHPVKDYDRAVTRRNYVLEEMAQNGHLPRTEAEAAKQEPLVTLIDREGPQVLAGADPTYFTAEVRRQLVSELGSTEVYEGGLTVRATIDDALQAEAAKALRRGLETYDRRTGLWQGPIARVADFDRDNWRAQLAQTSAPRDIEDWSLAVVLSAGERTAEVGVEAETTDEPVTLSLRSEKWLRTILDSSNGRRKRIRSASDVWSPGDVIFVRKVKDRWTLRQIPEVQGAFMAMDPHTGRVLALQGGFSYQQSVFNRATQAKRQPGSSFKPFVYAAALDAGYSPATIVNDAPIVVRAGGKTWKPKNSSGKFYGPTPLRVGLERSRNLMTVRIAQEVGMQRVADYAERFGVYKDMPHHLSYALGAGETTLFNMVAAYGMFANGGKRVNPTVIDRIQDRNGQTLYRHDPRDCQGCQSTQINAPEPVLFDTRSQIMSPVTAQQLVSMMEGVIKRGTAKKTVGGLGFPVAGKTGTTNDSRDAWFVGFSPNLVAGCFIGYDRPRPMGKGAYGGTLCGPVFKNFMRAAMKIRRPGKFRGPQNMGLILVKIHRDTGERLPDDAVGDHVLEEYFVAGTEPQFYTKVALQSDADLFGSVVIDDLPFADDEAFVSKTPAPTRTRSSGGASSTTAPVSQDVGLGTGGLY